MNKKICAFLITFFYCNTQLFSKIPIIYSEQYTVNLSLVFNDDILFDNGDLFSPSPERIKYELPIDPERYQKIFTLLQQNTNITQLLLIKHPHLSPTDQEALAKPYLLFDDQIPQTNSIIKKDTIV